jgi:sugar phosphate isomerase/epimerase
VLAPAAVRFRLSAFGDEIADDLDAQIASLRRHDVRFLELRSIGTTDIADLPDGAIRLIDRRLAAEAIGVSAIASPVGKTPIDGAFETELGRFRRILATARGVGTRLIRLFSFFIPDGRYREHRDEVIRRLAVFAREAEAAGVTLVHENESYTYGDTPDRCRGLIDAVGSPALRLAFDPANFVQGGVRPHAEAWPLLRPHVAHVHIKDAVPVDRAGGPPYPAGVPAERLMDSVRLPGEGEAELRPLLRALAADGYQGYLVSEPH